MPFQKKYLDLMFSFKNIVDLTDRPNELVIYKLVPM